MVVLNTTQCPVYAEDTQNYPDIRSVKPDLIVPPIKLGTPRAGVGVSYTPPEYAGTEVHHILYLPTNWEPDKQYPVIVEYAGNGPYKNQYGDIITGKVEDSKLGYGISGGQDFIWLCLP